MTKRAILAASAIAGLSFFMGEPEARADLVIKNPNDHPDYKVELEPHGNLSFWRRYYGPGRYRGSGEFGAGFRATIELGDPAFIPKLNNTVGISFGLDLTNCRWCRDDFSLYLPVAMQWNFFLTEKWSVFADLGLMIRTDGFFREGYPDALGMVGGRYHFSDKVSLTMRIGYPFISVGASFFL